MMALCSSAQVRPTMKNRPITMGALSRAPEQPDIRAGVVGGDLARRDAILQPRARVENDRRKTDQHRAEQRHLLQDVSRAERAEYRGPRERADDRLHPHQAKTVGLHLAPQPLRGPAAVVAGMRMVE